LIAGSGDVVHNLRLMQRQNGIAPYEWASRFNDIVKHAVSTRNHDLLINYRGLDPDAAMAVPTPEHFLPLLYVLAAQNDDDTARFFTDSLDLGSVSMLGIDIRPTSGKT
jgi:4,5-DOPA dioxygenase extradiol